MTESVKNNQHLLNGIRSLIKEISCPKKEHLKEYTDTSCLKCAFDSKTFPNRTCAVYKMEKILKKLD
jgi:hypothetical protein